MLHSNMAMVWAEIVLHKDVDWSTVAGLNVSLLDRSQHFIPTTWDRPSDCWPRWSNRRYGENRGAQEQERRTPPRNYEGPMYNDYNYGNDMGSASQSFGGGSGTEYYSGSAPQSFCGGSGSQYYGGSIPQSFGGGSGSQYYGGSAPQSFGEGSGSQYYGSSQYGTTTNSPNRYTPTNPWETDRGSQNWSSDPWDAYEAYENSRKNPSNLYKDYRNSPRRPLNSYESYRNWPRQDEEYHIPNYAPASYDGYGKSRQGRYDTPPRQVRTRDEEDAQFLRELEEATRRSRKEYVRRFEEENSFYRRQHNNFYDVFSREPYSGGARPSRRHDTDSEEE